MSMEIQKFEQQALGFPNQARQIQVVDQESLVKANDFLRAVRSLRNEISSVFDPIIRKAHEAHKEAVDKKKKAEEPLIMAERIVSPEIAAYQRKLEEERRRAIEEARRKEEERRRQEEELRRRAEEAEKEGEDQWAENYKKKAEEVSQSTLKQDLKEAPKAEKLEGTYLRKVWKWELEDFDKVPREFLCLAPDKINSYVSRLKEKAEILGIRIYSEDIVAVKGG